MMVSTTQTLDGFRIVRYCGVVSGFAEGGPGFLKNLGADIANFTGGIAEGNAQVYRSLLTAAREDMLREAAEQNPRPNAIIGYREDADYAEKLRLVHVHGTAVVVEPLGSK